MKVIIYYLDFNWDNHQGGSGKTFESSYSLDIPDAMAASQILEFIHQKIDAKIKRDRPFQQSENYVIQSIEIV